MRSNYYILLWVGRVDKNWTWKETPQKGSDGPRCLATFANLGHLCTCRTSSLSPSHLPLMCSCSSWFAAKRSRVLYLGDIPRIPSHVSFRGKHEAEGANHWMSGLNMLQDWSEIGHIGQDGAGSWLGWIKWRLFCFCRVKICRWSFIPCGNAILRRILCETTCCFREAFKNSTFIFHRNHVGQQSQDLPNHHNAKACSGNPGLLPELSPTGCMLNGWMVMWFLCDS